MRYNIDFLYTYFTLYLKEETKTTVPMKQLFTLCLVLFVAMATSAQGLQTFPLSAENKVTYTAVVETPGVSNEELYNRSKEWFIRTFTDGNQVLHLDDKASGKLIGKALVKGQSKGFACGANYTFPFVITVEVKDGRYRYTLSDIEYKSWVESQKRFITGTLEEHTRITGCEKAYNEMYAQLHRSLSGLLTSLQQGMEATAQKSEW